MVHLTSYRLLSSILVSQQAIKAFSFATTTTTTTTTTTMATSNIRGIVMVISPAKTLDLKRLSEREEMELDHDTIASISSSAASVHTYLCDEDKTRSIVNIMKKKSEAELKTLLSLSPSLANTAHKYWSEFTMDSNKDKKNKKKDKDDAFAVFTFNGPAFQGISAHTCNKSTMAYLSRNLFILDPVYGVLRSLDTMQPYRLEMGVKGIVANDTNNNHNKGKKETLAYYWKESVTSYLGNELNNNMKPSSSSPSSSLSILANLASDEYSSSIDIASLPANTIYLNVIFRHQGRVLAVHAKRARGLMARYLSETNAQTLDDVASFNLENYLCSIDGKDKSKWEVTDVVGDNVQIMKMVFDRSEAPPKAGGKRTVAAAAASTKQGGKKSKKMK